MYCSFFLKAEQLKAQLRLAEDTYADVHKELTELHQRLQESEEACDQRQKELLEFHRAVADENREKEALQKSNGDLRAAVKKTENERLRSDLAQCWAVRRSSYTLMEQT